MFQFGFLELWVTLIVLGTFLRGPNWNFFGPYEYWDAHKVEALNNVNLSEILLDRLAGQALPKAPAGSAAGTADLATSCCASRRASCWCWPTSSLLPPLMAMTVFRKFFVKMGFIRYMVMANLLLFMMALPIKMVLRWTFNLKYIIAIPEYFLNF